MARKRKGAKRKRSMRRWFKKRVSKQKIPFEVLVAGASIPFTPAATGFSSILDAAKGGDFTGVMDNLKVGFLGMDPAREASNFNLIAAINPFDMEHARFSKMLMYSAIVGMIRRKISGKYTNKLFSKIPILGRWVS